MWRWLPILIILIAAAFYYGHYVTYWFNPHDEGGFNCLVAQRLLNGERPWVDLDPGYNLGWFYPLVALFKITGPNYLAARIWCFVLSTITALLGYSIVSRVSGSRLAGLGAGLLLVVLPGSQFKNYIQLAQAANTACLVWLAFTDPFRRGRWLGVAALGGVVLGLTYLVRVEIGFFFTVIWLLLLVVFLLDRRLPAAGRMGSALGGIVALALGVIIAQSPVYLDMKGRGLEKNFLSEYSSWFQFLRASAKAEVNSRIANPPPTPTPAPAPAIEGASAPETPALSTTQAASVVPAASTTTAVPESGPADRAILPRKSVSSIFQGAMRDRMLALLTYAPLVGFGFFLLIGGFAFLRSAFRSDFSLKSPGFLWPMLVGASLTTFPQFFFFRPDRPHLSEFMTGYIAAMAACLWLLWPRGERRAPLARAAAWGMALFLTGQMAVYTTFAMQHPSSGTIAARFGRKAWFHGENGVHVREFKRQANAYMGIHDVVMKSSGPSDYLICFPYMPGYNVMTNRPTYLYNVYVDNATRSANFAEDTIRGFEEKHPAVVIIDDRAINGTEVSRFSRWAPKVHNYLKTHYTLAARFETVEVFTRPKGEALPAEAVPSVVVPDPVPVQ